MKLSLSSGRSKHNSDTNVFDSNEVNKNLCKVLIRILLKDTVSTLIVDTQEIRDRQARSGFTDGFHDWEHVFPIIHSLLFSVPSQFISPGSSERGLHLKGPS